LLARRGHLPHPRVWAIIGTVPRLRGSAQGILSVAIGEVNVVMMYVPFGGEQEATRTARTLLDERLIACANVYRSRSLYHWQGQIADETECVLVCKTTPDRATEAERRVLELHSYEVPCVLQIVPAHANTAYRAWVEREVAVER
jgi:periplasmic divalent cation tolerance protein